MRFRDECLRGCVFGAFLEDSTVSGTDCGGLDMQAFKEALAVLHANMDAVLLSVVVARAT